MANTNTVGDFIRSVFPTVVNKGGVVFKALFANEDATGTLEKLFNELEEERKTWCKGFYDQTGEQLKKTLSVFSVLTQLQNETEEVFLNRNELLFYRNGDTVWGDKWNILNIFKTFFNNENIYLVNNAEKYADSILVDGNFERGDTWTLNGCSYEREARFEETTGVLFNAAGTCSQTVTVESNKVYFLHFFLKGNIRVKIQDNNGRYWNGSVGDFGAWQLSESLQSFASVGKWDNQSLFFINDATVTAITITFVYESGCYAFLDYVRLCLKTKASMFSLIAVFEGVYTDETLSLSPGNDDPIVKFNYNNMGHYSPGNEDVEQQNTDSMSFLDDAPIQENISPVITEGRDDIEPLDGYDNMTYIEDDKSALAPKSPVGTEDFETVDYNKVSYLDNSFIFGATGKAAEEIYKELIEIVQPGGVTSVIEILTREQDD